MKLGISPVSIKETIKSILGLHISGIGVMLNSLKLTIIN